METVEVVEVSLEGIVGNAIESVQRRVTVLSRESWEQAEKELGEALPWTTRRANILVEGIDLEGAIGKRLQLGGVVLHIHGETEPCGSMELQCAGLLDALTPACRGGVHGSVEAAGGIQIGDPVHIVE